MTMPIIGRSFYINVGDRDTDKFIKFLVVPPECETIRHATGNGEWPTCGLLTLKEWLRNKPLEQVLVTPTDPVKLVVVFSTYPSFKKQPLRFSKADFNKFRFQMCAPKKNDVVPWLHEGF